MVPFKKKETKKPTGKRKEQLLLFFFCSNNFYYFWRIENSRNCSAAQLLLIWVNTAKKIVRPKRKIKSSLLDLMAMEYVFFVGGHIRSALI